MVSEDNAIYIKLDYAEALNARRGVLSSQLSSLNMAKKVGQYKVLRLQELGLKSKLNGKMRELKSSVKKLQAMLPSGKLPKIIQREMEREKAQGSEKTSEKVGRIRQQSDIDSQLREIQRRLAELQSNY